jgi:hypothetical protein
MALVKLTNRRIDRARVDVSSGRATKSLFVAQGPELAVLMHCHAAYKGIATERQTWALADSLVAAVPSISADEVRHFDGAGLCGLL